MKVNHKAFPGGYKFKNFKGQVKDNLIELEIPERVVIPLRQGFGSEVILLVKVGDRVKAGQIIAQDDSSVATPISSSVNGTVVEIRKINYFKKEINAVIIESDGTTDWQSIEGHSAEWSKLSVEKLEELLYRSGVTALDREGIPTRYKSSIIPPQAVEDVIVHGVGSEVYNISLAVLLDGKKIFNFVEALKILKTIMPEAKFHLALNKYKKNLIEEMTKLLAAYDWIDVYALDPKYPQGYDEVLIPTILDKKFPYGYSAANIGAVILNVQAVLQCYEAVVEGKPLIERTVALCGPGFKENLHVKVRVGTTLDYITQGRITEYQEPKFILNSLLTGVALSDKMLPIDRTFSQIIALPLGNIRKFLSFMGPGSDKDSFSNTFLSSIIKSGKNIDANFHGEDRPCVFCNFCQEVCPVKIIPHLIYHHVKQNIIDENLLNYGIYNCIECRLCSYVCPSKIHLAEYIKEGQDKMHNKCYDRSLCVLPLFDLKGLEEYRGLK